MEATPSIEQATCTNCDEQNFKQVDRDVIMADKDTEGQVIREARCACGQTATITTTTEGTTATDGISYEDASWNNVEEDDESED